MDGVSVDRLARMLGAWQTEDEPPGNALREALAELIDGAHLPAGQKMPGQRELAGVLGIARGTIARVYTALEDSGHLRAVRGSGTFVRHSRLAAESGQGRLTSFDDGAPGVVLDLSSGALPGTEAVARVLPEVGRLLHEHHLAETGYHPAGLPELRETVAAGFSARGLPTHSDEVLITAGSQQAVWLLATALTGPGDLVLVEDPTYRGALEAFARSGARLRGIPVSMAGADPNLLAHEAPRADLIYLQPSLHNPTGVHTGAVRRREIADVLSRSDALVIDDQSNADLSWTRSEVLPGFERLVDPARLLLVGTLSKLFWGGVRVGWIRGPRPMISRLTELRRSQDLSGSVLDQLAATLLLPQAPVHQKVRRSFLAEHSEAATAALEDILPTWHAWLPAGGSGLWIDTGTNAVALAQRALPLGVRLTAGPAFSPHEGHREFLRLPVWQPSGQFAEAMHVLAQLSSSDGDLPHHHVGERG